MDSPTMWLGLAGFALTAILMQRRVKGSIMAGILFVTVIAWIPGHRASYFWRQLLHPGRPGSAHVLEQVRHAPSFPSPPPAYQSSNSAVSERAGMLWHPRMSSVDRWAYPPSSGCGVLMCVCAELGVALFANTCVNRW